MWRVHLCSYQCPGGRTIGARVELVGAAARSKTDLKRSWSTPMTGTGAAAAVVVDAVDCGTGQKFALPLSESKCAVLDEPREMDKKKWERHTEPNNSGNPCFGGVNWLVRCGEYFADATDVFSSAHPSMSYLCSLCAPGSSTFGELFNGVGLASEYVEVYVQGLSVQPCAKVRRRSARPMSRAKQASLSAEGGHANPTRRPPKKRKRHKRHKQHKCGAVEASSVTCSLEVPKQSTGSASVEGSRSNPAVPKPKQHKRHKRHTRGAVEASSVTDCLEAPKQLEGAVSAEGSRSKLGPTSNRTGHKPKRHKRHKRRKKHKREAVQASSNPSSLEAPMKMTGLVSSRGCRSNPTGHE